MLKLLKIVRDAGEVTIKYPFAPAEFTPTFRGKPEYDPKRCISCAACAIACSVDTPNTGKSAPKARPWVTPTPIRTPVKLPGPRPNTMPSS